MLNAEEGGRERGTGRAGEGRERATRRGGGGFEGGWRGAAGGWERVGGPHVAGREGNDFGGRESQPKEEKKGKR